MWGYFAGLRAAVDAVAAYVAMLPGRFEAVNSRLGSIERALGRIEARQRVEILSTRVKLDAVRASLHGIEHKEAAVAGELDLLVAKVAANTEVTGSAVTLLQELKAKLDAAIAAGDMTAVAALAEQLGANTDALAAAVSANTPAA